MKKRAVNISQKAALALSGMAIIAAYNFVPVRIKEIAKILGCSQHHLVKVLQKLAKEGYLVSARGPNGGFALAKPPENITMKELFLCVEDCPQEFGENRTAQAVALENLLFAQTCRCLDDKFMDLLSEKRLADYIDFVQEQLSR